MFTADQIVAHLVGDYLTQSHWMATCKTKRWLPAAIHAAIYTATFVLLTRSVAALLVIGGSHFLIDRYRLARFVVWAKNGCHGTMTATGYPDDVPAWLSVWLLIIADNTIHILINGAALRWMA
jgi:hypothetical protein